MDSKTYIVHPLKTYSVVTVRTYYSNGMVGVGEEQVFSTLTEALDFIKTEEAALTCAN